MDKAVCDINPKEYSTIKIRSWIRHHMSWWLLGGRYTYPAAWKTKMYPWSSLNYHAILLTFYELRGCHKKKRKMSINHNS